MSTKTLAPFEQLKQLGACRDALRWCNGKTAENAWATCERGDWMLWLCGKLSGAPGSDERRKLVLCACECARLSLPHLPANELRPLKAIETAEAWAHGEAGVTLEDVCAAADAAAYAAADAAAYAAAYAAGAADAAAAAGGAAAAAAYAAAADATDIVRKHYPKCPLL